MMKDASDRPVQDDTKPAQGDTRWLRLAVRIVLGLIGLGLVGLAVLRWEANGWHSLVWLTGMAVMAIIRIPYASRAAGKPVAERRAVITERILLASVMLGGTVLPLVHLATGVFDFANYASPDWAAMVGACLLIPAFWLFWRSHADLGGNWSVTTELREQHELVTAGVYSRIRHPMYAAIWLIFLTQPLLVQNWVAGLAGPTSFAAMYAIRIRYEEAMMCAQFGGAYEDYVRRTGRLWPSIRFGARTF